MAPTVAIAIRKFSSNTCRFRMPLSALIRMSYPTVRYGAMYSTNLSQPVAGTKFSTTSIAAAARMRASMIFCFLLTTTVPFKCRRFQQHQFNK